MGLVSLFFFLFVCDVWRQWQLGFFFQKIHQTNPVYSDLNTVVCECFDDERDAVASVDNAAGFEILRVGHEGINGVVVDEAEHEDFSLVDGASDSGVASDLFLYEGETGFEDFGVVEKEDIVGEEDVGEVGEVFVIVGVGVTVWLAYEEAGIVVGECG